MTNVNSKIDSNIPEHPGKPIFWQEGLFLQPQHFQWQDLYFHSEIEPLNRHLQPSFWGACRILVQQEALSNHVFNVLKGEFRFRDMTHVVYPGNAVLESRNFEKAWKDKGKPFYIYLGIRKLLSTGKNVSDPRNYESYSMIPTRYTAERNAENLVDLYESGEAQSVERMCYVLKLLWEDEINSIGDYEIIPIARLESRKGEIILSPDYIPPVLCISASEVLMQCIKTMNELVTSTSNRLETYKKDRGVHTAEFGTKDMVFLLTLRTLNRFSPIFRHMLGNAVSVHPWAVYGVLSQLIGELSTFSSKINLVNILKDSPFYFLDYDHEDLTGCYNRARYVLSKLMAEIAAEPEYIAQFTFDGSQFNLDLESRMLQGRRRYYLVVETEAEKGQVIYELETQAKLSAPENLPLLVANSLRGLELTHIVNPPAELPRRTLGIYFSINHKGILWGKVIDEQKLSLSWGTWPEDVKIELMVAGGDE